MSIFSGSNFITWTSFSSSLLLVLVLKNKNSINFTKLFSREDKEEKTGQHEVDIEDLIIIGGDFIRENLRKWKSKTKNDQYLGIQSSDSFLKGVPGNKPSNSIAYFRIRFYLAKSTHSSRFPSSTFSLRTGTSSPTCTCPCCILLADPLTWKVFAAMPWSGDWLSVDAVIANI